jgi:hypothetical protein
LQDVQSVEDESNEALTAYKHMSSILPFVFTVCCSEDTQGSGYFFAAEVLSYPRPLIISIIYFSMFKSVCEKLRSVSECKADYFKKLYVD